MTVWIGVASKAWEEHMAHRCPTEGGGCRSRWTQAVPMQHVEVCRPICDSGGRASRLSGRKSVPGGLTLSRGQDHW